MYASFFSFLYSLHYVYFYMSSWDPLVLENVSVQCGTVINKKSSSPDPGRVSDSERFRRRLPAQTRFAALLSKQVLW